MRILTQNLAGASPIIFPFGAREVCAVLASWQIRLGKGGRPFATQTLSVFRAIRGKRMRAHKKLMASVDRDSDASDSRKVPFSAWLLSSGVHAGSLHASHPYASIPSCIDDGRLRSSQEAKGSQHKYYVTISPFRQKCPSNVVPAATFPSLYRWRHRSTWKRIPEDNSNFDGQITASLLLTNSAFDNRSITSWNILKDRHFLK